MSYQRILAALFVLTAATVASAADTIVWQGAATLRQPPPAPFASGAGTIVVVKENRLLITSADGKWQLRCDRFMFTPASKATTTISVVDGMIQLKYGDVTLGAAELHLSCLPDTCEAIGNADLIVKDDTVQTRRSPTSRALKP
jgi:hypothetical protein